MFGARKKLKNNLIQMAAVAGSLEDFAAELIAHVRNGGILDDKSLAQIRATCIRHLKNAYAEGMTIDDEAEVLIKAVENLEKFIDSAIWRGRQKQ